MTIRVRNAGPADAQIVAEFNTLIARETEGISLDAARVRSGVEAVLLDATKGVYFVAEVDGAVAGQLMITSEWSDWRNGNFLWIQSVYVRKEYRNHGVFKTLYRHVEALARSRADVCGLRLYVEESNSRAQQTYEALGMHPAKYRMMEVDFVL